MKYAALLATMILAMMPFGARAQDDLLSRMTGIDKTLHSYTATLRAHVVLTTFPFLSTDLEGTYYHKDPDRNTLKITSGLPAIAQQFGTLYPKIVPPAHWADVFTVEKTGDDGIVTRFKLTPKGEGNVQSIDAVVDDKRATLTSMTWHYSNGGSAVMNNTWGTQHGYLVVTGQTGTVDEPQYKGTITSTMTNYRFNPPIPDSVFEQSR
ncbi:MAG TPA: hypothetical protein VFN49_03900 [Candidatus Aquilonibacter sp.]|nr:hypothetical protein [Candidatus Aquilonibacter sp.]